MAILMPDRTQIRLFQNSQMELKTQNGGVTVAMLAQYSARIQAETGMGRIQFDFPLPPAADGASQRSSL